MSISIPKNYYILQNLKPVEVSAEEFYDWKAKNLSILDKTFVNGWWVITRFLGIPKRKIYLYECYINNKEVEKVKYTRTLGEAKNLHYKTIQHIREKKTYE